MIKDIKYNGFTEVPDDYECPDGDLAGVVDLVPEDGALKPVVPPVGKFVLPENKDFLFIHDTPDYTHYILLDKHDPEHNKLYWVDADAIDSYQPKPVPADHISGMITTPSVPRQGGTVHDFGSVPVDGINGVGNMLCVSAGGTTHYILWRAANGSYVYLGDVIPHPDIQFKLDLRYVEDFKSGDETGIKVVKGKNKETQYNEVVCSYNTERFKSKTSFTLTPSSALEQNRSYKLMVSEWNFYVGEPGVWFSVTLVYSDGTREFAAISQGAHSSYPHAVFTTSGSKTVTDVVVDVTTNDRMGMELRFELLKGASSMADGWQLKDEWEVFTAVMARANDFIARNSYESNEFIYPFFVRYAVRLYDGSYVSPGAPCLMIPNSGTVPRIWYSGTVGSGDERLADVRTCACVGQLSYQILNTPSLSDWSDLITGIVIAVSDPVWSYNQGREYKPGEMACPVRLFDWNPRYDDVVRCYGSYCDGSGEYSLMYLTAKHMIDDVTEDFNRLPSCYEIILPHFDEKEQEEKLTGAGVYHIVTEIDVNDVPETGVWDVVDMKEGTLSTLSARRTLDDNALTLSGRSGGAMSIYNSRLVLADITERKFKGHKLQTMQGLCGGAVNNRASDYSLKTSKVIVDYADDTSSHLLCSVDIDDNCNEGGIKWLYYPSASAKSAVICQKRVSSGQDMWRFAKVMLKPHELLDGAYWFNSYRGPAWTNWKTYPNLEINERRWADMPDTFATLRYPSKVQQSEVNNPLVFTNVRTNLVGTGRVMAVCAAVKALSQGQFGHFPLYSFTTEGVWSLSVGTDGAFSAIQPVTRDVCLSKDSVTQLDDAVLFATERGIMLLSGSTVKCISDDVNSKSPFDVTTLPQYAALLEAGDCETGEMGYVPFLDYIKGSRMIYDYVHQRVVVYNPDKPYAFVYSLGSGKWGMMRSDLDDDVNSWPEALGVDDDGTVVDFSETDPTQGVKGMLITRPFKLEPHDALKTINTIIQRGYFDFHNDGTVKKVQQILYGSRDLFNWHIVWSSQDQYLRGFRGTPYKYFRLALICNLDEKEKLYGFTVQYEPRYLNQPR